MGLIAPATLIVALLVAGSIGRQMRSFVGAIVVQNARVILRIAADRLAQSDGSTARMVAILSELSQGTEPLGFILAEKGRPVAQVGFVGVAGETVAAAKRILGARDLEAKLIGIGPVQTRVVGAVRLPGEHLLVLVAGERGWWNRFTRAVAISVLILVAAVVGTTLALSRLLVRPLLARLQALEQAMSRYRGGDDTIRLPLRDGARDEFDEVFSEFNRMADTIAMLNRERSERAQEKRKLMADLAHEINTPLTVLRGCAETLIEQEDRLDEATRSRLQAELLGQTLQVEAVVEDLLATASGESLEVPLHCGRFALDSLFDGIVDSFEPLARKRGMALVAEAGGLSIWADPARVRQMVTNLVRNALLHAQGATMIEIEAERVEDGVLIAVADDGPGLPEERRVRLLERYERGGSGGLGWGLGLVIVRTLAELHGGFLRLQPSDRGARFEIWLPDRAVRAPEEEA